MEAETIQTIRWHFEQGNVQLREVGGEMLPAQKMQSIINDTVSIIEETKAKIEFSDKEAHSIEKKFSQLVILSFAEMKKYLLVNTELLNDNAINYFKMVIDQYEGEELKTQLEKIYWVLKRAQDKGVETAFAEYDSPMPQTYKMKFPEITIGQNLDLSNIDFFAWCLTLKEKSSLAVFFEQLCLNFQMNVVDDYVGRMIGMQSSGEAVNNIKDTLKSVVENLEQGRESQPTSLDPLTLPDEVYQLLKLVQIKHYDVALTDCSTILELKTYAADDNILWSLYEIKAQCLRLVQRENNKLEALNESLSTYKMAFEYLDESKYPDDASRLFYNMAGVYNSLRYYLNSDLQMMNFDNEIRCLSQAIYFRTDVNRRIQILEEMVDTQIRYGYKEAQLDVNKSYQSCLHFYRETRAPIINIFRIIYKLSSFYFYNDFGDRTDNVEIARAYLDTLQNVLDSRIRLVKYEEGAIKQRVPDALYFEEVELYKSSTFMLARLYNTRGMGNLKTNTKTAEKLLLDLIKCYNTMEEEADAAQIYEELGINYLNQHKYTQDSSLIKNAMDYLQKTIDICLKNTREDEMAVAMSFLAIAHIRANDLSTAMKIFTPIIKMGEVNSKLIADVSLEFADECIQSDHKTALGILEYTLLEDEQSFSLVQKMRKNNLFGYAHYRAGDNDRAQEYFQKSLVYFNTGFSSANCDVDRFNWLKLGKLVDPAIALALLLLRSGQVEGAINYLEQAKARWLRERIALYEIGNEDAPGHELVKSLRDSEKSYYENGDASSYFDVQMHYGVLKEHRAKIRENINRRINFTNNTELLNSLPDDVVVLLLIFTHLDCCCIVLNKTTGQPITESVHWLAKLDHHIITQLNKLNTDDDSYEHFDALWKHCVEQVSSILSKMPIAPKSRLFVIPYGSINHISVHAARNVVNGRYFLQDYNISYAYSITLLKRALDQHRNNSFTDRTLLSVIDSSNHSGENSLEYVENEFNEISKHFHKDKVMVFNNPEGTIDVVKEKMDAVTDICFSTHAKYDEVYPLNSYVNLPSGEKLFISDIAVDLQLSNNRLVVLSACETGKFDFQELGNEHLGLTCAFVLAGATGVISSSWPVDDFATFLLITKFYDYHLGDARLDPCLALRKAQMWLMSATNVVIHDYFNGFSVSEGNDRGPVPRQLRTPKSAQTPYSHPRYWAGFSFYGT